MNIIKSYKEPDKHTIWFNTNDNNFYYFNNGKWKLMNEEILEITYFELKELRDASKLIPGTIYRITDYTCTTVQEGTQSAGHVFDILVTADDVNVLNENAHAIQHSGDTYFANSDLGAWELKYCLDNDTTRFAWADDSSKGRGVVYYMKDELFNECPYDFKNIQFKLVKLSSITWKSGISSDLQSSYDEQFVGNYVGDWFTVNEAGTANLNTGDTKYFYTFSLCNNNVGFDNGEIVDGSLRNSNTSDETNIYRSNVIPEYIPANGDNSQSLNFIIFKPFNGYDDECCCNVFGKNCSNNVLDYALTIYNTFKNGFEFNTFGNYCKYNTFENECKYNTFGNGCETNTFGNNCDYNIFGNVCGSNTFGNSCHNNTFEIYYGNNILGNNFSNNIFKSNCHSNTFGNYCETNKFGNSCTNNTFGNDCYSNTFGDECEYNTFENNCYSNIFGNKCSNNIFGNECYSNNFGNNFSYNTLKNKCYSNTFGNDNIRNTVGNECYSNTFRDACSNNMFGNNCFNNTFGNSCYNNTIGNLFVNNHLLDFCIFNAFGNNVKNNQFREFFTSNTFGNNFQYNVFATGFVKACTFFDNIQFIFVSTTASNGWELQNMLVLNGTQGTNDSNRLQIVNNLIQAGRAYTTTIGKNSSGTLTSKVLMDL